MIITFDPGKAKRAFGWAALRGNQAGDDWHRIHVEAFGQSIYVRAGVVLHIPQVRSCAVRGHRDFTTEIDGLLCGLKDSDHVVCERYLPRLGRQQGGAIEPINLMVGIIAERVLRQPDCCLRLVTPAQWKTWTSGHLGAVSFDFRTNVHQRDAIGIGLYWLWAKCKGRW